MQQSFRKNFCHGKASIPLQKVKIDGNRLRFAPDLNSNDAILKEGLVQIGFGHPRAIGQACEIRCSSRPSNAEDFRVDAVTPEGISIPLLPAFSQRRQIRVGRQKYDLVIEHATDLAQLAQAQEILARNHYMAATVRGCPIICRFADPNVQDRWRREASGNEETGKAVGVLVVDRLLHGNPNGREDLARAKGRLSHFRRHTKTSRHSSIVKALEVDWISRIAVEKPFQKLGIGTQLVAAAEEFCLKFRWPRPSAIEVMTTIQVDEMSEQSFKKNMFTKNGFQIASKFTKPSRKFSQIDPVSGERIPVSRSKFRRVYYYKSISS